jgi:hypothetical protein
MPVVALGCAGNRVPLLHLWPKTIPLFGSLPPQHSVHRRQEKGPLLDYKDVHRTSREGPCLAGRLTFRAGVAHAGGLASR